MNKINKQSLLQRIFLGELYRNYDLKDFDWGIIFSVFFLTLFGIIMVSSVSLPLTEGSFSLIISHISKVIISLIIFLLIFRFPINFWSKVDIQILLIAFFLLFLVFAPIIGQEVNGANRWIRVFGFSIQPSELMKFALIIYISSYCSRRLDEFKEKWLGFWKPILVVVMAISLVLFEPDLGFISSYLCSCFKYHVYRRSTSKTPFRNFFFRNVSFYINDINCPMEDEKNFKFYESLGYLSK